MGTNNIVFLEVIEWLDRGGQELVHRIPEDGSGEIKYGAQLIVRESQSAVFFYNGRAYDAFGPDRHTLTTANIPILTKVLSLPWAMTSPLRAEVYFVNMKVFANLKWGTRDPVAFRDSELGLVRLRAFGVFNVRVLQPVLFVNSLVGTQGAFTTETIEEYLSRVIVSRLNDHLGGHLDSVLNLPGRYEEISEGLRRELQRDFSRYGLGLYELYINAITPPEDVQRAIDDKGRLAVFEDLNKLLKMKAAMALEKVSETGDTAGAGLGVGLGMLMPAMFAEFMRAPTNGTPETAACPHCRSEVTRDARFCPRCGSQLLVFSLCTTCGKEVPPQARFCPSCGKAVEDSPAPRVCPRCGAENLTGSIYCNRCGDKLDDTSMGG